jgi:hypothetical protein
VATEEYSRFRGELGDFFFAARQRRLPEITLARHKAGNAPHTGSEDGCRAGIHQPLAENDQHDHWFTERLSIIAQTFGPWFANVETIVDCRLRLLASACTD